MLEDVGVPADVWAEARDITPGVIQRNAANCPDPWDE
jgi:hypothetical protein